MILAVVAIYFTYRELGSFPRSWVDEGLFIMTAKNFASGRGYAIPLLTHLWYFPYFLAVGPTVIFPAALSLKLFGVSVAAARLPMTLYILGTAVMMYIFTNHIANRTAARWSAALLVTLSAFINTGKPLLGEIPGFFFLILGIFAMSRTKKPVPRGLASGACFGLSIVTKLTNALILPGLAIAWIAAASRRKLDEEVALALSGITAVIVYLPWRLLEIAHTPAGSLSEEIKTFVLGGGNLPVLNVLRNNWEILFRLPFMAFFVILAAGGAGLWLATSRASITVRIFITAETVLFLLFFLNSYGWYRHLLTAHLLLIPFVPLGMIRVLRTKSSAILLSAIVVSQTAWQFTHQGSGRDAALAQAVTIVQERFADTDLLVEEPEVFAQLPENPHWLYLPRDGVSPTMPTMFKTPDESMRCFARLRKLNEEETVEYKERATPVGGYAILLPADGCR